jgi:hypothetical protein
MHADLVVFKLLTAEGAEETNNVKCGHSGSALLPGNRSLGSLKDFSNLSASSSHRVSMEYPKQAGCIES